AFGGRRDVMEVLAPVGPVYQAGTLSGNPVATAAGLAVLDRLDGGAYEQLTATASALAEGLEGALAEAGVDATVPRFATLVGLFLGPGPVTDYDAARVVAGNGRYPGFFHGLLEAGVSVAPGAYEALFPGLAHGPDEVDLTVRAAARAAQGVRAAMAATAR
ncbi:MAG: aspartate aminotransferase family protein, partial [Acidimicrobiales bacterium]